MEERTIGFEDFSIEMEDFEYKQVKSFDRIFNLGEGGSFAQCPFVYEGKVYVAGLDRFIYCIDARTGGPVWRFETGGGFGPSSPVVSDGILYIGCYDFNFYAIDADSGKLIWKFRTQGKNQGHATVHKGRVYFGSNDFNLYCLNAKNGELVWKYRTHGELPTKPTIYEGKVFFGSYDHFLYCLDADTGRFLWKFETLGDVFNEDDLLIMDDIIYFPSFDNMLRSMDIDTRRVLWKLKTGQFGGMHSSPRFHKGMLYVTNREGILRALTLEGKEMWKFSINHAMALLLIHNDRLYFGTEEQNLYCLDLDGKVLWKFPTQGELWWKPAISGRCVYFTSWDCFVYCVDIDTHKLVWKFRGQGAPSYLPPPFDSFELVIKRHDEEKEAGIEERKRYDLAVAEEEAAGFYKSRITYQISSQYAAKGKYRSEGDGF